jgi:uncharacterized protein (DUF608 family)
MKKTVKERKFGVVSLSLVAIFGLIQLSIAQPSDNTIDGTTGIPLGGIGTGAIKFCSHNGNFTGTWRTPCALDDYQVLANTQFQFFSQSGTATPVTNTKMSAVKTNGRADDDAVYPIQYTNFGVTNGVSVKDTAFIAWDFSNAKLMCYPYAFFQFTVSNTTSSAVDVAIAFQSSMTSASFVTGKGIKDADGVLKRAIYVASDDPSAIITAGGNDNAFLNNGQCSNSVSGTIGKVAAKISLAAGQSKLIKFVYAWHNNVTGAEGSHDGMFYYLNDFSEAGAVADTGLAHFDQFRNNAVSFVARMRASNLPFWLKNQTLVTLSNLTNNSMYRKDGRYAHTEGQWATNGTMDQMFHSRYIYTNLIPSMNWQELKYWARTQKTNPVGQIHHDIDSCQDDENMTLSRNMAYMCPWDAQQHHDYRAIDLWVDLNAVFILSVYEAFIQTADTSQLTYFWPFVDKAGKRMITQLTTYNRSSDGFPFLFSSGTQNTYDADGQSDMSAYNNSVSIPTFKILAMLAGIKNDATSQAQYSKYYDSMRIEFPKYYLNALHFPQQRTENIMTGPWENFFLKFGEMVDSSSLVWALGQLNSQYSPTTQGLKFPQGTYSEWSEYLVGHYGGVCLQTGKFAEWYGLQHDWYERIFNNRNLVYNTELGIPLKVTTPTYLATSSSGYNQYISAPVVWRNYYSLVGYFRNKFSGELWLEPTIPSTFTDMNHTMTDAVVFSPEGPATISFKESGTGFKVQDIMFKPDNPVTVTNLYVKDRGFSTNYIKINGVTIDNSKITKIGTGFAKELKIAYNETITTGITITVSDDPSFSSSFTPVRYGKLTAKMKGMPVFSASPNSFAITTPSAQPYSISITGLNGKVVKRYSGLGMETIRFGTSAQTNGTLLPPGVYIAKIKINNAVFPKRFALCR